MSNVATIQNGGEKKSLVTKFSSKFGVEPEKMMTTLKATAFKQRDGSAPTNEQMMALMVVADQYGLNPFTREIYAFPDKQNGIVPVVGVDGWSRIINSHPDFDGMDFNYSEEMVRPDGAKSDCHVWVECIMYRKDRSKPIIVREYLDEVYRPPFKKTGNNGPYTIDGPWQSHPKRFLRHKATIQCARLAFGFVGIFDQDEAERIVEHDMGDAEVVAEEAQPKQFPVMDDNQFSTEFDKWVNLIESGKKSADDVIAMVSSKYQLSDEQIGMIRGIGIGGD